MKRRTILILLIGCLFVTLFCGSLMTKNRFCGFGKTDGTNTPALKKIIGAWQINDGTDFQSTSNVHFKFDHSNHLHLLPKSKSLISHCTNVVNYLLEHPKKNLKIIGYYLNEESNNSSFNNLGLARGQNVKEYLTSIGLQEDQIQLESRSVDARYFDEGILKKGIEFTITESIAEDAVAEFVPKGAEAENQKNESLTNETPQSDSRIQEIKNRLQGEAMLLYFGTTESYLSLSQEQQNDIADMKYYLENVNDGILEINGHTDSKGKDEFNQELSEERAQYIKNIFVKDYGFIMNKLVTSGYGESQPITKNRTSEERAKNRRVEVILR